MGVDIKYGIWLQWGKLNPFRLYRCTCICPYMCVIPYTHLWAYTGAKILALACSLVWLCPPDAGLNIYAHTPCNYIHTYSGIYNWIATRTFSPLVWLISNSFCKCYKFLTTLSQLRTIICQFCTFIWIYFSRINIKLVTATVELQYQYQYSFLGPLSTGC